MYVLGYILLDYELIMYLVMLKILEQHSLNLDIILIHYLLIEQLYNI